MEIGDAIRLVWRLRIEAYRTVFIDHMDNDLVALLTHELLNVVNSRLESGPEMISEGNRLLIRVGWAAEQILGRI